MGAQLSLMSDIGVTTDHVVTIAEIRDALPAAYRACYVIERPITCADFTNKSLDEIRAIVTGLETGLFWLGKRAEGDFICYQADKPAKTWRGYRFTHAVGPFFSRLGAAYYACYGQKNPAIKSPADAERWAREDNNALWSILRESIEAEITLTPDDIAAYLADEAREYTPALEMA